MIVHRAYEWPKGPLVCQWPCIFCSIKRAIFRQIWQVILVLKNGGRVFKRLMRSVLGYFKKSFCAVSVPWNPQRTIQLPFTLVRKLNLILVKLYTSSGLHKYGFLPRILVEEYSLCTTYKGSLNES